MQIQAGFQFKTIIPMYCGFTLGLFAFKWKHFDLNKYLTLVYLTSEKMKRLKII